MPRARDIGPFASFANLVKTNGICTHTHTGDCRSVFNCIERPLIAADLSRDILKIFEMAKGRRRGRTQAR